MPTTSCKHCSKHPHVHSASSLFVSHGPPTLAIEDVPARRFLRELGQYLGRPRAIVMVSAHWETPDVRVLAGSRPATVHDFFGFDAALYDLQYPAPGATALAAELGHGLAAAGFAVSIDHERGYDHGTWMPLLCMYPDADIPVTQISVCPQQSALFHWRLGRAIAALKLADVLVIGSGALTHNLPDFRPYKHAPQLAPTPLYAQEFAAWVADRVAAGDKDALIAYRDAAPHAERAHPSPEHLLPLLVALGAAPRHWIGERLHQSFMYGVISMDCYQFRPRVPLIQ